MPRSKNPKKESRPSYWPLDAARASRSAKRRSLIVIPPTPKALPNPHREGSRKRRCFEIYRAGGEREQLLRAMRAVGVAKNTARIWFGLFGQYVLSLERGGR
jgi:hypothetical protein